jgi:hypothetical protein
VLGLGSGAVLGLKCRLPLGAGIGLELALLSG